MTASRQMTPEEMIKALRKQNQEKVIVLELEDMISMAQASDLDRELLRRRLDELEGRMMQIRDAMQLHQHLQDGQAAVPVENRERGRIEGRDIAFALPGPALAALYYARGRGGIVKDVPRSRWIPEQDSPGP